MKLTEAERRIVEELRAKKGAGIAELVRIAGLNPATDLVGGNFRGVNFEGDDLDGYNLSRADLTGADLRKAVNVDRAMFARALTEGTRWPNPDLYPGKAMKEAPEAPTMILIPAGRYLRGASTAELEREEAPEGYRKLEQPQQEVTIRQSFWLAAHPVTVGEFRRFVRDTGRDMSGGAFGYVPGKGYERSDTVGWDNPGFSQTDDHPVTCVNEHDADAYAGWLADRTRRPYRLPSEAEWEYACRAGTTTARFWGDDRDGARRFANVADFSFARAAKASAGPERVFQHDDGYAFTSPVGAFAPNPWGLYDMLGNVWEWMADDWFDTHEGADCTDAKRTTQGSERLRVVRGASWGSNPWLFRSASRDRSGVRSSDAGIRLARTL